ncbi:unnamed protein product [Brassica rapa]|uniref:Uncharacterized protein n=1 Tax=Brassica campestris TaxID=3711 RepID=A0A3P6A367_BRACM|nr:unnamed protein product [Brassica rapa]VDC83655.1 unnamed protein product [Brassica rapa]
MLFVYFYFDYVPKLWIIVSACVCICNHGCPSKCREKR